jgi:hypothetical protein
LGERGGSRAAARAQIAYPPKIAPGLLHKPRGRDGEKSVAELDELTASNTYIEAELCERLKRVEEEADADVLTCVHPILMPFDDFIRDRIEDIPNKRKNLLVVLETDGGSIETTERIADVFRYHYKGDVSFLIPNFAMSAGTILVMSGDRILMDYYSVLGPIDPQVQSADGKMVPALGYLEKYNELIAKSDNGDLTQAELAFLLDKFDPADLHRLEQAREHSIDLLKRWLVEYKFKNWTETRDRKKKVTPQMKVGRAREIANKLNNTRLWRSHGRGLSLGVVEKTLNLIVEDFGTEPGLAALNTKVRSYYRLLQDYIQRRGAGWVIHTRENLFGPWKLS